VCNPISIIENKRIAKDFIEQMFNKGNVENAGQFGTSDFIYHARGEDITGLDKFKACVWQLTTPHSVICISHISTV
jgi:hypothetical protein